MARDAERDYWEAVALRVGERCDFYSAEELAAFAEGNLRGRNARALEAHVKDCADCRGVVEELRRELAPEPASVRVRFAPARGWIWALAAGAVTAALIVAVMLGGRGTGVQSPVPGVGPRPGGNVARVSPDVGERPAPPVVTTTPEEPGAETPPVGRHPGARRRHARPPAVVEPPGGMVASAGGTDNPLPSAAALAFAEPLAARQPTTAEVEELLREGAVNDLPEGEAEPLDEALVNEFYQGFDELVQDLRAQGEGAGQ